MVQSMQELSPLPSPSPEGTRLYRIATESLVLYAKGQHTRHWHHAHIARTPRPPSHNVHTITSCRGSETNNPTSYVCVHLLASENPSLISVRLILGNRVILPSRIQRKSKVLLDNVDQKRHRFSEDKIVLLHATLHTNEER